MLDHITAALEQMWIDHINNRIRIATTTPLEPAAADRGGKTQLARGLVISAHTPWPRIS